MVKTLHSLFKKFQISNYGGIAIYVFLILIMLGAFFLAGGATVYHLSQQNQTVSSTAACCDSGDGDACKPADSPDKTITYGGEKYGLLKTQVDLVEGNLHLKDSGQTVNGKPIILNSSDTHATTPDFANVSQACKRPDPLKTPKDLYFTKRPADPYLFMRGGATIDMVAQYCDSIPNDELIFVCKQNCTAGACTFPVTPDMHISCYGTEKTVYDVYYRLKDYPNPGIPNFIKNCEKAQAKVGTKPTIVALPAESKRDNLQMQTFGISFNTINPGLSPFCKPAIYLYPERKTDISVAVNPMGHFTHTDPLYPAGGWKVTAYSDGKIDSNGKSFPYLYYEADIQSSLIDKPETGYVIASSDAQAFLLNLLPKLGLNIKETQEMAAYWQKALPKSPYYFIGQIPVSTLNHIAPLVISPKPDSIIRVALYFEPLDKRIEVQEPEITTPKRTGFTVVEWGGIVHSGKPFTCLQ